MSETLFSKIKIGNVTIDNRIGLAPMTRTSATATGLATENMAQYYANFARGGFGLVITEGTYTDEAYSQGYLNQPGIATKEQTEAWKKVVKAVHQEGSKIVLQLMHAGALSQGNRFKEQSIGPSAIKPKGEKLSFYGGEGEFSTPKEMTEEDISQVIQGFVTSAKNAKEAGFDGVEIHGANGYILDQFLTDYTNERQDQYGGSTENRMRLLIEVVQAVREAVGQDYPVGIRIGQAKVNDPDHKWKNGEADAEIIFSQLGEANVDYIHIPEPKATEPAFGESGPTLVELVKKYGNTIAIANGSLEDPQLAKNLLAEGKADIVTIGKGALSNQDWPKKVLNGQDLSEFDFKKFLLPKATLKDFEVKPKIAIISEGMACGPDGLC
ncbi:NADH:flavin oxidoreductase [Aquibacillus salsiterrae]|uniref:NADH:flavin oxidoreductase n=1 Tax=Aquibacillus salsiterrae TaxID=2950439 RepID=A0A9X3WGQ3_9BACI|nr:NADH:flavin oxidoreductase [Aquibacillus salsiterrae]MDC3418323.1 NADH:flavin oxidoreductase [Aquibacillus salsiterrae]